MEITIEVGSGKFADVPGYESKADPVCLRTLYIRGISSVKEIWDAGRRRREREGWEFKSHKIAPNSTITYTANDFFLNLLRQIEKSSSLGGSRRW